MKLANKSLRKLDSVLPYRWDQAYIFNTELSSNLVPSSPSSASSPKLMIFWYRAQAQTKPNYLQAKCHRTDSSRAFSKPSRAKTGSVEVHPFSIRTLTVIIIEVFALYSISITITIINGISKEIHYY